MQSDWSRQRVKFFFILPANLGGFVACLVARPGSCFIHRPRLVCIGKNCALYLGGGGGGGGGKIETLDTVFPITDIPVGE